MRAPGRTGKPPETTSSHQSALELNTPTVEESALVCPGRIVAACHSVEQSGCFQFGFSACGMEQPCMQRPFESSSESSGGSSVRATELCPLKNLR